MAEEQYTQRADQLDDEHCTVWLVLMFLSAIEPKAVSPVVGSWAQQADIWLAGSSSDVRHLRPEGQKLLFGGLLKFGKCHASCLSDKILKQANSIGDSDDHRRLITKSALLMNGSDMLNCVKSTDPNLRGDMLKGEFHRHRMPKD